MKTIERKQIKRSIKDCFQEFPFNAPRKSPFTKLLSLGYYDGTTSGIVQCGSRFFLYETVAWDGDAELDIRVFSLSETDSSTFESLVQVFSEFGLPKWPAWYPTVDLKSPEEWKAFESKLESILSAHRKWEWVIATTDILGEILAGREITEEAQSQLPRNRRFPPDTDNKFWYQFLGLDSARR